MNHDTHNLFDWVALGVVGGVLANVLPAVAALMSIIWYGVRLYDRFFGDKHGNKRSNDLDS